MTPPGQEGDAPDDEDQWRFSPSDFEDDGGEDDGGEDGTGDDDRDDGDGSAGVAGSFSPSETIEPGEIDPENALFVLVGVTVGLAFVATFALLYI